MKASITIFPFSLPSKIIPVSSVFYEARSQVTTDPGKALRRWEIFHEEWDRGRENRLGTRGPRTGTICHQSLKISYVAPKILKWPWHKKMHCVGRKVMTNLDSIFKSRDITLPTKVHLVKAMVFPVVVYGCESWTVKKAEHQRIDAF